MSKWFAVNHNGYLEYLGEHEIDDDVEQYFWDLNEGDYHSFMGEEEARDNYDLLKNVFEEKKNV